jgi:signal transduction histidine kinase
VIATSAAEPTRAGDRARVRAAAVIAVVGVTCALAAVPANLWLLPRAPVTRLVVSDVVLATVWPLVGVLVVRAQPRNAVGWILVVPAVVGVYLLLGQYGAASALVAGAPLPGATAAQWVAAWGFAGYFFSVPLLALYFPDGRLPGPRWRAPVALLVGIAVLCTAITMIAPIGSDLAPTVPNPLGVPGAEALLPVVLVGSSALFVGGTVLGAASVLLRLRRAAGVERAQLQWLVLGVVVPLVGVAVNALEQLGALDLDPLVDEALFATVIVAPPVAVGVAVLRHRLFDVELVLGRTVVYAVLTLLVVVAYALAVSGIGWLTAGSPAALVLVAVAALLAATGRSTVQRLVDRWLFGHRHDPYAVVSRVGRHVAAAAEPVEGLQRLVEALRDALRLPFVAFTGDDVAVVAGAPTPDWRAVPSVALGRPVGELRVGLRRPGEVWSAEERSAIDDVADRAATLAYAAELVRDVARSRERIVLAREEERRRLSADLHDGVGPALAGTALELDALARRAEQAGQPDLAGRVRGARDRLRRTVGDVRTVAHGLRPPALEQLGLAAALRELCPREGPVRCSVEVGALPGLPAAVEVATYAVVGEAVSNALRHSAAGALAVRVHREAEQLVVEVVDDGCGVPPGRRGLGLRTMRERAAELGGRLDVGPGPAGGTAVRARLPLGAS